MYAIVDAKVQNAIRDVGDKRIEDSARNAKTTNHLVHPKRATGLDGELLG